MTASSRRALVALLSIAVLVTVTWLRAQPTGKREQFIYVLRVVPEYHDAREWTDKEAAVVHAHFDRLSKATESRQIILAGRTNEALALTFGVVIFEADDADSAMKFMQADPAVLSGLMSATLHPYAVALQRKPAAE